MENLEKNKLLSIGEASEYLGISIDTLRRWEKKGKIESYRSPGGHRYFKKKEIDTLFGRKYERTAEEKPRKEYQLKNKESEYDEYIEKAPTDTEIPIMNIVEREVRKIEIPVTEPVRIISQNITSFEEFNSYSAPPSFTNSTPPPTQLLQSQESLNKSILEPEKTPTKMTDAKKDIQTNKQKENFVSNNLNLIIILAVLFLITIFLIIYLIVSPEKIISPVV